MKGMISIIFNVFLLVVFGVSIFVVFWAMVGYPLSLKVLAKIVKLKPLKKNVSCDRTVTVMVVAHNEEKVIREKLENLIETDYPEDKIEFLVASDNSDDRTNEIVEKFISENKGYNIRLYVTKEHKGKTNAQNEAQKTVTSDILVMTDANSMFKKDAVKQLVACFEDEKIAYVTGRLSYYKNDYSSSEAEDTYWEGDLQQRLVESGLFSVTAGNGAIYACRNDLYHDFDPIRCHDSAMPRFYAKRKMRSVYTPDAVAYEKAGETAGDEFKRKVRMNRCILKDMISAFSYLNPFQVSWFAYCYFGHRVCRYNLWLAHIIALLTNVAMVFSFSGIWQIMASVALAGHIAFYLIALFGKITKSKNKIVYLIFYYVMTITAQFVGAYKEATGKSKPIWEKAESTR